MSTRREKVAANQSWVYDFSWILPPRALVLGDRDVHVWRASLDLPAPTTTRLRKILSQDELDRSDRFHFAIDRDRFVCARSCLRLILARYMEVAPQQIRFAYSDYGKPSIANPTGRALELSFNLAHSAGLALYAFTRKAKVGVDLEQIRADFNTAGIAARFFSANEVESLCSLARTQQALAFFNCWSRKEAFIKALGTGLSQALDQFDVTLDPNHAALVDVRWDRSEVARWSLQSVDAGPDFAAAVAFEDKDRQVSYFEFRCESFGY